MSDWEEFLITHSVIQSFTHSPICPVKSRLMAKSIVITGSTRGIGLGLANELLKRGCNVTISGRTQLSVDKALASLAEQYGLERLYGLPCDVSDHSQLSNLWHKAHERFGSIDIWINNAGVGIIRKALWEQDTDAVRDLINTNLLGVVYGSQVALKGMIKQGGGAIYNMEGFGSNGMTSAGMAAYGASKSAVTYLTRSLQKDSKEQNILVGLLSPGVVDTELLRGDYDDPAKWDKAKRTLNILGDKVETVTPYLADKILANTKAGARISWLTPSKVALRFATARIKPRKILD